MRDILNIIFWHCFIVFESQIKVFSTCNTTDLINMTPRKLNLFNSFNNKSENCVEIAQLKNVVSSLQWKDHGFQELHQTFGEIQKLYKPNIVVVRCVQLVKQLKNIQNIGQEPLDWLLNLTNHLPKNYLDEFNYLQSDSNKSLQLLADAVLTNGKPRVANRLLEKYLSHQKNESSNYQFCNKLIERLLDETIIERFKTQSYVSRQIERNEQLFNEGCKGLWPRVLAEESDLYCYYEMKRSHLLRISPIKVEILNIEPYVARYYEMINESEILYIRKQTVNKVRRSQVNNDARKTISGRSSSETFLDSRYLICLKKLMQRIEAISNTNLAALIEPMVVIRYRIGELYKLHYDFDSNASKTYEERGNRFISTLFYLTNVQDGGDTVFPYFKLSVKPIRKSMLLWHNLHSSIDLDYRTKHGACPVLKGTKWVATQSIHNVYQEFVRPCALQNDGYKSHDYLQDC